MKVKPDNMNVAKKTQHGDEVSIWFLCKGCNTRHRVIVAGKKEVWGWNGSLTKPTFTPSVLCTWNEPSGDKRCHSYITEGQMQYLGDCTHELVGQTVPLKPIE